MMMSDGISAESMGSVSVSVSTVSRSEDDGTLSEGVETTTLEDIRSFQFDDVVGISGLSTGMSDHKSMKSTESSTTISLGASMGNATKAAELASLKNAIKLVNLEAIKAEELYKAERGLLQKANEQLFKFSRLLQDQDAELAATEEALSKERKQRESAEKHFIKLKKMMVVKDVEVTEAEQRKKSEVSLRKGAEKEMTMLRRQLQAKEAQLAATDRKYQKECKKRERFENQMTELAKKAGKANAEEKYQMLQQLRQEETDDEPYLSTAKHDSYDKWKQKEQIDPNHHVRVASLMAQLNDVQDQLKHAEEDLHKANDKFTRERQLREEADKQVIVMREKGYAYNIDRRTTARSHVEDCLNTERLKLRNADLQEQYELLKVEARKALEKARDRVRQEKTSREALEEQLVANRKHFEDALEQEKQEHKKRMEELAQKVAEARSEIEVAKSSTSGTVHELADLRQKQATFQEQVIEAKADSKKEKALRSELKETMETLEDELDSMEAELKAKKEELQKLETKYKEMEDTCRSWEVTNQMTEEKCQHLEEKCQQMEAKYRELESTQQLMEGNHQNFEAKFKQLEVKHRKLESEHRKLEATNRELDEKHRKESEKRTKVSREYRELEEKHQEELSRQSMDAQTLSRDYLELEEKYQQELNRQAKDVQGLSREIRDLEEKHQQELGRQGKDAQQRLLREIEELEEKHRQELDGQAKEMEALVAKERDQKLSQLEALIQKERDKRIAHERELAELRVASAQSKSVLSEAEERAKMLDAELSEASARERQLKEHYSKELTEASAREKKVKEQYKEELAEVTSRWTQARERYQEEHTSREKSEEAADRRVHMLEAGLQSAEAQCKVLKEQYESEQGLKEKAEEEVFELNQRIKKLTFELEEAETQHAETKKQCSDLRLRIETVTISIQTIKAEGETSEKKLKEKISSLTDELRETREQCASMQQSLEETEEQIMKERELRRAIEVDLSMEERSLGRRRREEAEQEIINIQAANHQALRLVEDKLHNEKQLREEAEELCRSLREQIVRLKHEQVVANQKEATESDRKDELEYQLVALKDELELAVSKQKLTKDSLDEERKLRGELEKQNQAFRDMIPEYAEAEEKYQKERRLRSEAESTVETLRKRLTSNKFWHSSGTHDESTIETNEQAHQEMQQHVIELQTELESMRSDFDKAQAALEDARAKADRERHQREDAESQLLSIQNSKTPLSRNGSTAGGFEFEKKRREKAEKQVMSMRLKIEAKDTEIVSLKSKLTDPSVKSSRQSESQASSSTNSSERRRRGAALVGQITSPQPSRQLDYRSSFRTNRTYSAQTSQRMHAQEEQDLREQILLTLPDYVKNNFSRIGFVKHSTFDYWPSLVLDPFTVPLSIRTKWLELYYEFEKRDMFLVYLYGRRHRGSVNAYPIVEPHHFIAYEEGVERNLDQLPAEIEDKLRYGEQLSEIEEELSDGLTQIRIDARQQPRHRTHPLDERGMSRRAERAERNPSMTSTTSYGTNTSVYHEDQQTRDSPKRPRSEYSYS
ncbi:IG_like [Seminavis robusta]|uniref:IG_like n=1 Tax=Seminavis robusta TaxID=568900 RepID=A0A9N8E6H7_9STRA|nr:IG_like [Seminavis robusta]|eukprot:Sro673_g185220.1 IG_like (1529) ;mRNA; r:19596-24263